MGKITFMGAGSTVFAKNVLGDCMLTPVQTATQTGQPGRNFRPLKDIISGHRMS